ncbi:MAG: alpha/beta fold hydrolase [Actinomycetota bacterium]|nr:alpha/beta fold hydrolase [Actinomycetota bacterium]
MEREEIVLHGHRVSYRQAGWGPLIVLIHGITGSSDTWLDVIDDLAQDHTVVAPDLLGHGESAKPRGDYSLGAYASGIRDLLAALGHDRGTVVGHSLGGGVAMQMAYQFPERVERMVLVSSGGLGREVNLLLRAAALPGSELVLPLLTARGIVDWTNAVAGFIGRFGLRPGADLEEIWRGFSSLSDVEARTAFVHTLRGIIDPGGQRVSARDRLYLAAEMPSLIVWGERDPVIPFAHGLQASEAMPGSRLVSFPDAGHFPHREDPRRFANVLLDFMEDTSPSVIPEARLREMLREGA